MGRSVSINHVTIHQLLTQRVVLASSMPPRRATRSARASVGPEPQPTETTSKATNKRKRSQQPEGSEEEDDSFEELKRKGASVRKGRAIVEDSDDDEWGEPPKTLSKARKSSAKSSAAPRKSAPRKSSVKPSKATEDIDEYASMNDSLEEKPTAKGRKSTKPAPPPKPNHESDEEVEESDVELMPVKPKKRVPTATSSENEGASKAKATLVPPSQDEDEDEKSLLDAIPPPLSQSQPRSQSHMPPPPEEPKGPQARLTIHKMALINFKSYAGRQEIGPFHKVGLYFTVVVNEPKRALHSHFLRS